VRIAILALLALAVLAAGGLAYVRYELRPRPAHLDPAATGLPVETLAVSSLSGRALAGWYLPGEGRGAVLLLHGAKSNRLALVDRMRMLRDAGYSSLAIDFQAHGESEGDRITLGRLESQDARSALDWLRQKRPGDPIAVLGISMGGAAILLGDPIRADAVILESAFPDLAAVYERRVSVALGPVFGRPAASLLLLAMRLSGVDAANLRPIDGIRRLDVPVFVMSGADDRKVTVEEARDLFAAANSPKAYWEVPGARHVDLAYAGGGAYRERLLRFLDSTLRRGDFAGRKTP
jgi:uncharacterized protein